MNNLHRHRVWVSTSGNRREGRYHVLSSPAGSKSPGDTHTYPSGGSVSIRGPTCHPAYLHTQHTAARTQNERCAIRPTQSLVVTASRKRLLARRQLDKSALLLASRMPTACYKSLAVEVGMDAAATLWTPVSFSPCPSR